MPADHVEKAAFRLGRLSADPDATNESLLRGIAGVAADVVGLEVTGLGVFDRGVAAQACACRVVGPWSRDESDQFLRHTQWAGSDRVIAIRLESVPTGEVVKREELIPDREYERTRLYQNLHRPMSMGDQVYARFRRTDGCELVFGASALDHRGDIPGSVVKRMQEIAPYVAACWEYGWKIEPAWARSLKPAAREVLRHVIRGLDDDQIAELTGMTYHAVRAHLKRLFREAGVRSRLHLMQAYRRSVTAADEERTEMTLSTPAGDLTPPTLAQTA